MVDEFVVEFADERGRLAAGLLAPFDAGGAVGEGQGFLGAGDADVEEAAFLVFGSIADAAAVGEEAFLESDEINDGKLQSLGRVEGDEGGTFLFFQIVVFAFGSER